MYYIELTREKKVEDIFEINTEEHIKKLPQKIFEANQEAGFVRYITAPEYLNEILAFAKEQKNRADIAELKLAAAEFYED